jgi:hypothetical protein
LNASTDEIQLDFLKNKMKGADNIAKWDNLEIKCELISHSEHKFHQIMQMDGLSPKDITESLSLKKNIQNVFHAGQGSGESGSFFFFSHDNRFLVKTMRGSER